MSNASNTFPPPSPQPPPGHASPPATSTTTLEQVARQLGLTPRALVRLCVKFRLPAHAYGGHTAGANAPALPYPLYEAADNHFTDSDVQVLHHVHTRILAGDTLSAIARDWQQQQQLVKQVTPPKTSTFANVLQSTATPSPHTAKVVPKVPTPAPQAPPKATKPMFQQLAGQLGATSPQTVATQPPLTKKNPAPAAGGINALFSPKYSPAIGLSALPDIDPEAIFTERRRWPTQQNKNTVHQQPQHQQPAAPTGLSGAFLGAIKQGRQRP